MKLKSIITLIALAMVMPELVTGSTPLYGFLNPVSIIILFIGYGIAILLIREYFVRKNLGYFGLFLLGLAYVAVNEGLLAKTLIIHQAIPFPIFDNYGYMAGISWPWSLAMGLWHAMYSVMFPIVATHFLFPEVSKEPWLGKKTSVALLVLVLAFSMLLFFGPNRGVGTGGQLIVLLFWILAFVVGALYFGKKREETAGVAYQINKKPVWLGVSTFLFITVLLSFIAAGLKLPIFVFIAIFIGGIMFYIRTLSKKIGVSNDTLLLFILGGYVETAVTGLLMALLFAPPSLAERLPSEIIILAIATILIRKVIKKHNASPAL